MLGMWIFAAIIFGPVVIGVLWGLFEGNNHPHNIISAWNDSPDSRPVFDNQRTEFIQHNVTEMNVKERYENPVLENRILTASEPSTDMDDAIHELISAIGDPTESSPMQLSSEKKETNENDLEELLAAANEPILTQMESVETDLREPPLENDMMNYPIDIEAVTNEDPKQTIVGEDWVEEAKRILANTEQSDDSVNMFNTPIKDSVVEAYTEEFEHATLDEPYAEMDVQEIQPQVEENLSGSSNDIEDIKETNSNTIVEETAIPAINQVVDIFTDVPELFQDKNEQYEDNVSFTNEDIFLFSDSEYKKPTNKNKTITHIGNRQIEQSISERTAQEKKELPVDQLEYDDKIIDFPYGHMPTPLNNDEYKAIQRMYGSGVALSVTTTPAQGRRNAEDIMIGRLEENCVGLVLSYGNYFSTLKGNVPKDFIGNPILVYGQFYTEEEFYVTNWCDPAEFSEQSAPPFRHNTRTHFANVSSFN